MSDDSAHETMAGFSETPAEHENDGLVQRIITAYAIAVRDFGGHGRSMWHAISSRSDDMHRLLLKGDEAEVSFALRNPHTTDLFYGFDNLSRTTYHNSLDDKKLLDRLVRLASATAAIRLPNSAAGRPRPIPGMEDSLSALDDRLGFRVDFPNPYPFEWGLRTSRGIASYRALQALYQAWRLSKLARGRQGVRILEIGGGLGRTAYYARKFGLDDYTIVDLPLTNVAQAHFLASAHGSASVGLVGEPATRGAIRILGPRFAKETKENFDIILNVDSITELDQKVAESYFAFAAQHARYFLSMNHENNPFTFRYLAVAYPGSPVPSRFPYWMREGYVEELVDFASDGGEPSIVEESDRSVDLRRELAESQRRLAEQQEIISRLGSALPRTAEEATKAAASLRILASRSATFAHWLHLLRTKPR